MVADAVTVEPVYSKQFPGNREKYRENIKPSGLRSAANSLKPVNTRLSRQIPCTKEQGKLMDKQGLDSAFQGGHLPTTTRSVNFGSQTSAEPSIGRRPSS